MKILVVTPLYPPEIGGPATRAVILERELPKRGIEVDILPFSTVRHRSKVFGRIVYAWQIFKRARSADLLYVLDPVSVGFPAMIAAFFAFRPYLLSVVGDYAWEQGVQRFGVKETLDQFVELPASRYRLPVRMLIFIERFVARFAKRIVAPSKYLKGIITLWGVDPAKISVVYNAFHVDDMPKEHRAALRKRFVLYGTVLFSASRLVPWKGFRALITLMPEIVAIIPEAVLYIAGSGPDESVLRKLIEERKLEHHVKLLGNLPHDELMARIAAADCFVLNTGYEGFSHLLLEAMALGTPVITTPVGGNPELIENGKSGLLVGYDDRAALHSAILALYAEPDRAWALAAHAQSFAGRFTEERMLNETIEVFERVLNKKKRP